MRKTRAYYPSALLMIVFMAGGNDTVLAQDAKKIFTDNKCNSCHSITAQSVAVKKGADEEKSDKDKEPPDLSGVGLERKADWIVKYLMKKEAIKGEKHDKKFKGSEAELNTLAQWLETLKTKAKK